MSNSPIALPLESYGGRLWKILRGLRKRPMLTLIQQPASRDLIEPFVFRLRWLLLAAFALRFWLRPDVSDETVFGLSPQFTFTAVMLSYLIGALLLEYFRRRRSAALASSPGQFRRLFGTGWEGRIPVIFDTLLVATFFLISRFPESDIPYFFVVPLILGAQYLPVRNNLFAPLLVGAVFTVSTAAVMYLGGEPLTIGGFLRVAGPKLAAFAIVGLYLLWTLEHFACSEAMLSAVFEHSNVGIAFIGQQRKADKTPAPDLDDMPVLRLNRAQSSNAPGAQVGSTCRREFASVWYRKQGESDVGEPCPWCPVKPVLTEEASNCRSITASYVPNAKGADDIGYFDVSTSPARDEYDRIIAAVEIVKEVTPQIKLAALAKQLLATPRGSDAVIAVATQYFREMFRFSRAVYVELRRTEQGVSASPRAYCDEEKQGALVGSGPPSVAQSLWDELQTQPWDNPDLAQEMLGGRILDQEKALQFWRLPSSPLSAIVDASDFTAGLVARVDLGRKDAIGLLAGGCLATPSTDGAFERPPRDFTVLDLIAANSAAALTAVALQRAAALAGDSEAQQKEVAGLQDARRSGRELYMLFAKCSESKEREQIIGMSLLAVTHRTGLRFSRAVFLGHERGQLVFELGTGPVTQKDSNWVKDDTSTLIQVYERGGWLKEMQQCRLTRVGLDHEPIPCEALGKNSVFARAIEKRAALLGTPDDEYVSRSSLCSALHFDQQFAVVPVCHRGELLGLLIADQAYLEDKLEPDLEMLQYVGAVCGSFLGSACPVQIAASAAQAMLEEISPRAGDRAKGMADLAERVARAARLQPSEIKAARLAAYFADLPLAAREAEPFWLDARPLRELSESEQRRIKEHAVRARLLVERCRGSEAISRAVEQHQPERIPEAERDGVGAPARVVALVERYMALTDARPYKQRYNGLPAGTALKMIRDKDGAFYGNLIDALAKCV